MTRMFDDSDERKFFCEYIRKEINEKLSQKAEECAVEPVILIEEGELEAVIAEYENG